MIQGQMSNIIQIQQQRIAELEADNRDLRRQLDELRRGAGIAVLIDGQAIPLTTLTPAPAPRPPVLSHPTQLTHPTQPIPAIPAMPATLAARPTSTSGRMPVVRGTAAPSTPYPRMPLPRPSAPAAPAQDDGWLTGATPVVRPRPSAVIPAARPSSNVTPAWLRDEAPTVVAPPVAHVAPVSQPAPVSQMPQGAPRRRLSTGPLARASVPRLQPEGFPTLAQITGRMRAVRAQPQPELWPGERNPYADSFVLG